MHFDAMPPTVGHEPASLPVMTKSEEVAADYNHLALSLKAHPLSFLRTSLAADGFIPSRQLSTLQDGRYAAVAGIVLVRQQPDTASGVIFLTLEDETGAANIVLWPRIFQKFRRVALGSRVMGVSGRVQRDESGHVIHIVAAQLSDLWPRFRTLTQPPIPRDMPGPDPRGRQRIAGMPRSREFR
jgi:error-prone DNA polymerase